MAESKSGVDVTFINPFIEATLQVLKTTCNTACSKDQVFVRHKDQVSGDVSALIAVNSSKNTGSMAVSFEKKTFLGVVSNMFDETFTEISSDIADAAGELCNQIFGITRRILNEQGNDLQPAIPSVIIGDGHRIQHPIDAVCIAVKFKTEFGFFTVEAVVRKL